MREIFPHEKRRGPTLKFDTEFTHHLTEHHLTTLGMFHPSPDEALTGQPKSVVLLGLAEPGFWTYFKSQPEWLGPDPLDNWSKRIIDTIAHQMDAEAYYPFGGPPWHPFYRWALQSGETWESPIRLLVHHQQGLMVSFRGALGFRHNLTQHEKTTILSPCESCIHRECLNSCPAQAFKPEGYDVAACKAHLEVLDATPGGKPQSKHPAVTETCLTNGCRARRSCPISQKYARDPAHSAYHMCCFLK